MFLLAGTIETLAFRDITNGSDLELGNFTVTDKFNCRDYRVNLYFPQVCTSDAIKYQNT